MTFTRFFSLIAGILLCVGCSSVTVLKKPAKEDGVKLDRVIIVALSTDYSLRSMVEKELSYDLRQMDYNVYSSVNIDENKKELYTRDEILQLIEEKNIHGVITVKLKDVKNEEKYSQSEEAITDPYAMTNYFYVTSYTGVYNWSYVPLKTVVVETSLFDAKTKAMIFQAEGTYKNSESQEEGAAAFAKMFSKAYDDSGLLKKK